MNSEQIAKLVGSSYIYEYQELDSLPDSHVTRYINRTRQISATKAQGFGDRENTEWFIRTYLSLKYVLASTVLITSSQYAEKMNLQITLPYLNYYTLLNCSRAFLLTMPCIEWHSDNSISMTHSKTLNVTTEKLRRLGMSAATQFGSLAKRAQAQRELFSYRFPASGLGVFGDDLVSSNEIETMARKLVELAQVNLSCFETAIARKTTRSFKLLDLDDVWKLMKYETSTGELIDDDDYQRVGYFIHKYKTPSTFPALATEGLVEDFFGAWHDEKEEGYDPDRNWNLLVDIR
ncbi:MAG: hypothetical protein P1U69_16395 [Parvibaculaceae bacterium]|nr:hypothetical protein [Parvibaculaceae bacterium]